MNRNNKNSKNPKMQSSWLPSKAQSFVRKPEKPLKPNDKPGTSSYNGLRASRRARLLNALSNNKNGKGTSAVTIGVKRSSQSLYDFEADHSYEDDEISLRVDTIMATLKPSYDLLSRNGPRAIDGEWITSPRIYKTKKLADRTKSKGASSRFN